MDVQRILAHCDHTLLSPTATFEQIKVVIDEAKEYKTASVCIPPSYVKEAKEYVGDEVKICTVIGFPLGYSSTEAKLCETGLALSDGADEVDVVMNIGRLKAGDTDYVLNELKNIVLACKMFSNGSELPRKIIVKVIIETCLLTEEEKIKAAKLVTKSGADYIKTSTGFSSGGATLSDVALLKRHIGKKVKIKAAGGISSLQDAEDFLNAGCDRLGTSRLVRLAKEFNEKN